MNAQQLGVTNDLDAVVEVAKASGLPMFVGVVVPRKLMRTVLRDVDNATADIVGRLGARLLRPRKPRC